MECATCRATEGDVSLKICRLLEPGFYLPVFMELHAASVFLASFIDLKVKTFWLFELLRVFHTILMCCWWNIDLYVTEMYSISRPSQVGLN